MLKLLSFLVILSATLATKEPRSFDLQVNENNHGHPVLQVFKRLKRQVDQQRIKRDYIQWYGGTASFQSQQNFQPGFVSSYQIQSPVPFYVPIWGNPGRIPVFFPAKPILFNPGYPVYNRPGSRQTTPRPTNNNGEGEITIGNRINTPQVNEEGLPIWGIVETDPTGGSGGSGGAGGAVLTTSRPNQIPGASRPRPRRPQTPPLLHSPSLEDRDGQTGQASQQSPQNIPPPFVQRTTTTTRRPQTTRRSTTQSQGRQEPSRCVWAIISCCNPTNTQVSYSCFERLGCPGLFVDGSPCTRENTAAALNAASQFYAQ